MSEQGVYKTNVTCSLGLSIQSPDGSWEKANIQVSSDVGPGYPEPELMRYVMTRQMEDATKGCEKWIEDVANKIIEQIGVGA